MQPLAPNVNYIVQVLGAVGVRLTPFAHHSRAETTQQVSVSAAGTRGFNGAHSPGGRINALRHLIGPIRTCKYNLVLVGEGNLLRVKNDILVHVQDHPVEP